MDDEPSAGEPSPGPQGALIRLYDNLPSPGQIIVPTGTRVEWKNMGANDHTVTNYSQGYDEWDDVLVKPGQNFVHVFLEPGDYGFICIIHQEVGYISVVESDVEIDP
jgi:plastocyanin